MIAGAIGVAWVGIVLGMWLTKPVIAVTMATTPSPISGKPGQTFGNPGELVVLEPEKWIGQRFSLSNHINIGSQLTTGQWIILLVHHDCDQCAAAVPRYVARYAAAESDVPASIPPSDSRPPTSHPRLPPRLAIIELPPFADPTDPPPWQLPPSVLSGRLDQTRDWFATTPVALRLKDSIVIGAKDGDDAEIPGWGR